MRQTILSAIIGRPSERHSKRTEKAKEEMTNHQQQSEALFEEWARQFTPINDGPQFTKDDTIAFAAFCLEKNGWKKYPDERPEKDGWYAIKTSDSLNVYNCTFDHDWEFFWDRMGAIAFMSIPEYKP